MTTSSNSGSYQIKLQLIDALGYRSDWQQIKLSIIKPDEGVAAEDGAESDGSANLSVAAAEIGAKYAA